MLKKRSVGMLFWIGCIYAAVQLSLWLWSQNLAYKENTYINKAIASIRVFEDSWNQTEYSVDSADLYKNKWTSGERINNSYKKVSVIHWTEATPVPTAVSVSVRYIYRESH